MLFRKATEQERSRTDKASMFGFGFYILALIVWSIYDFIATGDGRIQLIILSSGCLIFFSAHLYLLRKIRD